MKPFKYGVSLRFETESSLVFELELRKLVYVKTYQAFFEVYLAQSGSKFI